MRKTTFLFAFIAILFSGCGTLYAQVRSFDHSSDILIGSERMIGGEIISTMSVPEGCTANALIIRDTGFTPNYAVGTYCGPVFSGDHNRYFQTSGNCVSGDCEIYQLGDNWYVDTASGYVWVSVTSDVVGYYTVYAGGSGNLSVDVYGADTANDAVVNAFVNLSGISITRHCDYGYSVYGGTLDSYPYTTTSDCTDTISGILGTSFDFGFIYKYLGSILLALAIFLVLTCLGFIGFIFNKIFLKKPWL
jgi:hypothetical protein